jgi:hypothetical protein
MDDIWSDAFLKGIRGLFSHPDPFEVLDGLDWQTAGKRVPGMPHTIWQISRHIAGWGWAGVKKLQGEKVGDYTTENNFFPFEEAPPSREVWQEHLLTLKNLPRELEAALGVMNPESRIPEWHNILRRR